ncbi:hypothetical protein ACEV6Q_22560 [Enterobacter ludwigii]|uniref:hypothetical protein n=1 Tax=Enterobacter ludwigii TaxID=299767 RepID=UPI003BEF33B5
MVFMVVSVVSGLAVLASSGSMPEDASRAAGRQVGAALLHITPVPARHKRGS